MFNPRRPVQPGNLKESELHTKPPIVVLVDRLKKLHQQKMLLGRTQPGPTIGTLANTLEVGNAYALPNDFAPKREEFGPWEKQTKVEANLPRKKKVIVMLYNKEADRKIVIHYNYILPGEHARLSEKNLPHHILIQEWNGNEYFKAYLGFEPLRHDKEEYYLVTTTSEEPAPQPNSYAFSYFNYQGERIKVPTLDYINPNQSIELILYHIRGHMDMYQPLLGDTAIEFYGGDGGLVQWLESIPDKTQLLMDVLDLAD